MREFAIGISVAITLTGCCLGGLSPAAPPPPVAPLGGPTPASPGAGPMAECTGHWLGVGSEAGAQWTIDMNVVPNVGGRCGTIEYPSLGCGGYLVNCVVNVDGSVTFTEVYTHNPGTCAPAGTITSFCSGGQMRWNWAGLGDPASAVLLRS